MADGWSDSLGALGSPLVVAAALLVLLVGLTLGRALARRTVRRRAARGRRLGARGEQRALRLLARAGYDVLAQQVEGAVEVLVDGVAERFRVRADGLAARDGQRFLVEVKATAATATLSNRATRRQLLEYACAFEVDGILLVDADAGAIHHVAFAVDR